MWGSRVTFLWYTCFGLLAAASAQVDSRGLIEQALDEPATITFDHVTLRDAIQQITEQTGVRIEMVPEVMDLVPHGGDTMLEHVSIANMALRRGLTELFTPLGMEFIVRDRFVEIVPKEALLCLGRAPSWAELDTLAELSTMQPGVDPAALSRLEPRIQFQVPVPDGWAKLSEAIRSVGAGSGDQVLSIACQRLGWAWCFFENRIVISSVTQLLQSRLQRRVNLRMNHRPLIKVLHALGDHAQMPIRVEPGALASLSAQTRQVYSLNVSNASLEQALDEIAAFTGLGYLLEPDGVLFYRVRPPEETRTNDPAQPRQPSPGSDPYVGKIVVPLGDGTTVEWHIRRSELPLDLRKKRQADLDRAFEALRRQAAKQEP